MMEMNSSQMTKNALLKMLSKGKFPNNRLPSEVDLAKQLRVSVVTLRQALTVLETEGYIIKKQGVGSFALESALDQKMRIDLSYDFESLLETSGYAVKKIFNKLYYELPPEELQHLFQLQETDQLIVFEVYYTANERVAIVVRYKVPQKSIVKEIPNNKRDFDFDTFIWNYCEKELLHGITAWKAEVAKKTLLDLFDLKHEQPFIAWDQIIYDRYDQVIAGSEVYFNPEIMCLRSLCKWNFMPE